MDELKDKYVKIDAETAAVLMDDQIFLAAVLDSGVLSDEDFEKINMLYEEYADKFNETLSIEYDDEDTEEIA